MFFEKTYFEFLKNLNLNKFQNIKFENRAISNLDNEIITFNESENDWESSQSHSDFNLSSISKVNTLTIDTLTYQPAKRDGLAGNSYKVEQPLTV